MKRWLWLFALAATFGLLAGIQKMSAAQAPAAQGQRGPNERFYTVQSKLDQGGSYYMYTDLKGCLRSLMDKVQPIMSGGGLPPEAVKIYTVANQVIDRLGIYGIYDLGISSVPDGDLIRNKVFVSMPDGRQGLGALLGGVPHPFGIMDRVTSGALVVCSGDFDTVAALALVRQIVADIGGPEGTAQIEGGLSQINAQSGMNVEAINKSLGGEFAVVIDQDPVAKLMLPIPGLSLGPIDAPRVAVLIKVKDGTLYDSLKAQIAKNAPTQAEAIDGKFKYIILPCPPNPFWPLAPAIGTDGEYVYLTTHLELSRTLATPKGGLLKETEEFKKLAAGLPTEGNGLAFVSPRMGAVLQQVLKGVMTAVAQGGAKEPMQAMQFKLIEENLNQATHGGITIRVNQPDGIFIVNRSMAGAGQFVAAMAVVPAFAVFAAIGHQIDMREQAAAARATEGEKSSANVPPAQGKTKGGSRVNQVKADLRTLSIGIEAYKLDTNTYPAWTVESGRSASGAFAEPDQPSFMVKKDADDKLMTLTTPIAYLSNIPKDPFAPKQGAAYSFWAFPKDSRADGYIIWSAGPDGKYDLNQNNVPTVYNPTGPAPSPALLDLTYDPSNGTKSPGDIWRVKGQ